MSNTFSRRRSHDPYNVHYSTFCSIIFWLVLFVNTFIRLKYFRSHAFLMPGEHRTNKQQQQKCHRLERTKWIAQRSKFQIVSIIIFTQLFSSARSTKIENRTKKNKTRRQRSHLFTAIMVIVDSFALKLSGNAHILFEHIRFQWSSQNSMPNSLLFVRWFVLRWAKRIA